jgi:glycosyltransferase involved in cell wall biosynthesis
MSAFDHYVLHGAREQRRPHPDFDVQVYARWKTLDADKPLSVISHWIDAGGPTSRRWLLEGFGLLDLPWLRRNHDWAGLSDDECIERIFAEATPQPGPLFDPLWYVSQPAVALDPDETALDHFLRVGRQANLSPGPWLEPAWYLQQNPDVAASGMSAFDHYRLRGEERGLPPSASFVPRLGAGVVPYRHAPLEQTRSAWVSSPTELGGRSADPGWLKAALQEGTRVDARLGAISSETIGALVGGVFVGSEAVQCAVPLLTRLQSTEILFLLPDLGVGGAIREAANVARAASEVLPDGSVAVVTTDGGPHAVRHWFPENVECVALQREHGPPLDSDDAALTIANLIAALKPRLVINVNSRAAWLAYRDYGASLSLFTKLRAMLFCRDYTDDGRSGGYADEFLLDTIAVLDRVAFDNRAFIDQLIEDYFLLEQDRGKLIVVYHPAPRLVSPSKLRDVSRVLWIGRISKQKSPELLAQIAHKCPDLSFDVFGLPNDARTARRFGLDQDNINLPGVLANHSDLNPERYGAFLFTSEYEGLPNILLEVGALGIPIVCSAVGGITELVRPGCGWAIPSDADVGDYVGALRQALDPEFGETAAQRLQRELAENHSWDAFIGALDGAEFLK